ncbi:hypothetical protein BG015_012041 [Linnemannia schmuckeri]|uniref:HCP-like protein n=1 Tax=Linnemannia schmuckeri TaxID=64567 RepID=A0A9P5RRX9_9FUNG|nr:hypothetical protein BG015_012041 [Linnemannia schmuckeri]
MSLDPLRSTAVPDAILDVYIDTPLPQTDIRAVAAAAATTIPLPSASFLSTPNNFSTKLRNPACVSNEATDNELLDFANMTISPGGPQFVLEGAVQSANFYDHSANTVRIGAPQSANVAPTSKISQLSIQPGTNVTSRGLAPHSLTRIMSNIVQARPPNPTTSAVSNTSNNSNNSTNTSPIGRDSLSSNVKTQQSLHTLVEHIAETIAKAGMGNLPAQVRLRLVYKDGSHGLVKNHTAAMSWFRRAAEKGDASGQYGLAQMCELDQSTFQYKSAAKAWYHKAAEQGHVDAQRSLGALYSTEKSYAQALEWYLKAAEQGDKNAQYNFGRLYNNDQGTPLNYGKAMEWYGKAAEQGHVIAKDSYDFLKKRGHSNK